MKLILLAATALIAAPLAAQTTPTSPDPSTMPAEQTTPEPATAPADSAPMPAQTAPMQDNVAPTGAMASEPTSGPMQGSTMTPGGYQPSAPAMSGAMTPGVTPVYRPAPTPDQAYPAPAPLAKYPICKKGQYDKCMQPGGR